MNGLEDIMGMIATECVENNPVKKDLNLPPIHYIYQVILGNDGYYKEVE
jgi:hypothetical protein